MINTALHVQGLQATSGVQVTVTRGVQTCTLTAVPAASTVSIVGKDGSFTEVRCDDWIVLVADWTLTAPAMPAKGDKISIGAESWYVANPDAGKAAYRNFNQLDRPAVAWRIHSMQK